MEKELAQDQRWIKWIPQFLMPWIESRLKRSSKFRAMLEAEDVKLKTMLEHSLKPYHGRFERHYRLPKAGVTHERILADLKAMHDLETPKWESGFVSGGIYHGDHAHISFLNEVYALHSQSNPLHSDLFPSATKFEAEIVSMVSELLGKGDQAPDVCGTVTSGGTESILLAMKVYRDRARRLKGIKKPEIILCKSAHAAFDKAAQYFGIKLVKLPFGPDYKLDPARVRRAITRNTIAIVGSTPSFPHGVIDPIPELSEIAFEHGIGFHSDACLGGFVIPFADRLGYSVPAIDFRLRGVTSISVDTHKYGYAAKGTSVVLYRDEELRREQYFTTTEWPGGLYFSPTLAGSRPGALSAACWASLLSVGEDGYMNATATILKTADKIRAGIQQIDGLTILGDPLWIIAFGSDRYSIYEIMDQMSAKGWSLNGLHHPECVHIALTLRHAREGVAERFLSDLNESVRHVAAYPGQKGGMAPVYGMASSLPFRGLVSDLLKKTLDILYRV